MRTPVIEEKKETLSSFNCLPFACGFHSFEISHSQHSGNPDAGNFFLVKFWAILGLGLAPAWKHE